MDLRTVGIAAALGSAFSWAVGSILFKRIGEKVCPFGLTLSKGLVSLILLGAVVIITKTHSMSAYAFTMLFLSGLLGIAIGDTLFFAALRDLGPVTLVVFFMLGQIMTAFFGVIFLGEIPPLLAWLGIVLTLGGIALVLWSKIRGDKTRMKTGLRGIMLGAFSMLAMSISVIFAKKGLLDTHGVTNGADTNIGEAIATTIWPTFIRMAAGTLGMIVYGLATQNVGGWLKPYRNPRIILFLVISVCVITFGGFWLSLVAVKMLDVAVANTLNATEPLFMIPLALLFLKEKVTPMQIGGTVLSVIGVIILCNV